MQCYQDFAQFRSHKRVPPAPFHPQAENSFQIWTHHPLQISFCLLLKLSVMGLYKAAHMVSYSTYAST